MIDAIMTGVILGFALLVVVTSSILVEERKERRRKGLTDYYDNPIEKEKE